MIRAGQSIDSALLLDHPASCSEWALLRCVELTVDGPAGEEIDVTLGAVEGQPVGFFFDWPNIQLPTEFPQRLTVLPGRLWVMGGPARFTVTAARH
jgi:hypothetical protein